MKRETINPKHIIIVITNIRIVQVIINELSALINIVKSLSIFEIFKSINIYNAFKNIRLRFLFEKIACVVRKRLSFLIEKKKRMSQNSQNKLVQDNYVWH